MQSTLTEKGEVYSGVIWISDIVFENKTHHDFLLADL